MRGKYLAGIVLLMLTVQGVADAQAAAPDSIRARQQNFKAMGAAFKAINDQIRKPVPDVTLLRQQSAQLSTLSARFASQNWFPKGSGPESEQKTKASPDIWAQSQKFAGMRSALNMQAKQLSGAAATGDVTRIKLAVKGVGQSCAACHKQFRMDD